MSISAVTRQRSSLGGFALVNGPTMTWNKLIAWCVHGYTALGLVAAGGIAVAILYGTPASFRLAFALMLLATVIDATDGTLARHFRVKEVLPGFDGRRLDDLIDIHTYTSLPLLLVWKAQLLPEGFDWCLLAALLASAYGFCQVHAKTDDGYFLGFPSYWNVVAFYLYVVQPPGWIGVGVIMFFALLTFVPARYLYPSHRGRLNRWTNQLGALWCVLLIWILFGLPETLLDGQTADATTRTLAWISLAFPAYYLGVSWFISVRLLLRARRMRAPPSPIEERPATI
jgi:phosphatidylcholine synthase